MLRALPLPGFGDIPKPFFLIIYFITQAITSPSMRKNIDEFALPQQSGYTFSVENVYRVPVTDSKKSCSGLGMHLYRSNEMGNVIMA
jgi:hypothetical protein